MSDLVEKVATKIQDYFSAADKAYGEHDLCARAAIAAVAEWLAQSEDRECNPLQALAAALRAAAGSALEAKP